MMEYKGYTAKVEFDADAEIFHGRVLHLRDVITFQGRSVDELKKAFVDSVDDYVEFCAERGEEPERPYSGKFLIRIDPSVHRQIAIAASVAGESINSWTSRVLEQAAVRKREAKLPDYRELTRYVFYHSSACSNLHVDLNAWTQCAASKHSVFGGREQMIQKSRLLPEQLVPVLSAMSRGMSHVS